MARLYKRSDKPGSPWFADYYAVLPGGRKKRRIISTKTPDKATAKQILAKLQSDAAVRHFGIVDPLVDRVAQESARSIEQHLKNYQDKMTAAGRTQVHIDRTSKYITQYARSVGCASVADISAETVNRWAAECKNQKMAARTIAARLTAIKGFSKWLTEGEKLLRDPLVSIKKPNAQADRRRERRMLLPTEWPWLMRATEEGEDFWGVPAAERRLLYRLDIQTGLRPKEIRSLGRGAFHLDMNPPFVKVVSGETKNRKVAYQYLDMALASDLAEHLKHKLPGAAAFSLPSEFAMADMIRGDIAVARRLWLQSTSDPEQRAQREQELFLTPKNEAGELLDFYSLRHTCGAWLAMRGVQAKVIQSVMRHSTITLTLDTYGHLIEGAEAAAIQANADMTAVPTMLAATGTE